MGRKLECLVDWSLMQLTGRIYTFRLSTSGQYTISTNGESMLLGRLDLDRSA